MTAMRGGAVGLHGFHALDHLHRLARIGKDDPHVLAGGVAGREQLGVPVLVDDAGLVQPEELEVGVPGHAQGGPQPEQQDAAAGVQQVGALLHRLGGQQPLGVGKGLDVLTGHLLDDLVDAVPAVSSCSGWRPVSPRAASSPTRARRSSL